MIRNILWCYVFLLTLLDLSLNTKLTAQGESHGVSIHDSLIEGVTFQEWGKESGLEDGEDAGESVEGVWTSPRALRFGRAALGAAHARAVTITNRANTTLHLASVAGTTPDFHASFFESKKLPPQGNTTFNVVYLGRHEGPVAAHLYIHTSLGVHKYPVSAVGVASQYGVWPLVGLRVPLNASVEPELTLYNPTDTTIQVSEVYSTGAWLGLRLPAGGERAPRAAWAVPPRTTRTLVRLRVAPHEQPTQQPLTAYVSSSVRGGRVKANIPGGGLLVAVEARAAPPGEYARPPHVRLSARGAHDPAYTVELELANSGSSDVSLEGAVSGAGCWRDAPLEPCAAPAAARANGGAAVGAHLSLLRSQLAPHQDFIKVAQLTLNFAELWAQAPASSVVNGVGDSNSSDSREEEGEAWCAGCVRLGRAHVPYSVRLLPGALRFTPPHLDIVTMGADATQERELRAHNQFGRSLTLRAIDFPDDVAQYFNMVLHTPLTLHAGTSAAIAHLRLRDPALPVDLSIDAQITVHTDLSQYKVPLRLYSGKILFEWEWANATETFLELGAVGTSATRRVGVRLRNPAPIPLCIAALSAKLPGAAASFARAQPAAECILGGSWAQAWLTVVAPAREGPLRGELQLNTTAPHATTTTMELALRVRAGHVRLLPLRIPPAAPYAGSWAELQTDSTMSARMRVTRLSLPPRRDDPALAFQWEGAGYGEVRTGRTRVARARHTPEKRCEPTCYCGLPLTTEEGMSWLRRSEALDSAALREDLELLQSRLALFDQQRAQVDSNFTLHMHTTEVVQVVSSGSLSLTWPRLAAAGAGRAPLAAVRRAVTLRLALRSTAHTPLLLQALLAAEPAARNLPDLPPRAGGDSSYCLSGKCSWSGDAFRLAGWRVTRGAAAPWNSTAAPRNDSSVALPLLLLAPHSELELSVQFTPHDAGAFTTYLYLRNNLTILEGVQLFGEGEYPSFDIAGRRPGSTAPFLFECLWGGAGGAGAEGAEAAVVRRVVARNLGRVPVSLSRWRVAGAACAARGFAARPCSPLQLQPNASAPVHLSFTPDYTLARVAAPLHLHTDRGPAEFLLVATIPAKVLSKCAASAPRPPWDGAVRSAGVALAFLALAFILAAAALDAERLLRRARAARAAAAPRAPLDLRSLAVPEPPVVPPVRPPTRRKRAARRPLPALDPRAERRAFERWRAEVLRRDDDSSRSSEDDDTTPPPLPTTDDSPPTPVADEDGSTASDESIPVDERDDEPYSGDVEPDLQDDPPHDDTPLVEPAVQPACAPATPPPDGSARPLRARRDVGDAPRRAERVRNDSERRSVPGRHHVRKERATKRRAERVPPTPPPRSPAPLTTPITNETPESRGAVRWGTPWSSVVAARGAPGPALAPIGSDVRRREPERAPDNSLFYFNGTAADTARAEDFTWRPAAVPAERQAFVTPARDYLEEARSLGATTAPYGTAPSSVWGAWGAWPTAPVRPPPGFTAPAPAAPPPEPRTYDPFRSLASIWAPAPNDWRAAPAPNNDDHRD
ncbi:transmembrane protein 131 homolog isoform X2 [Maniola hyperantus]|uniref:transmembrane protein 131 homolog isoform X2 n=1 Tax=Aphantopus hyperantus TaxID=2795564 RepID=UPI003748A613